MRLECLICGSLAVNTYIVGADNTNDVVVIDPGEAAPVIAYLDKNGLHCTHILITHGHFDHTGGAAELKAHTGALLCIHEADAGALQSNRASLSMLIGMSLNKTSADVLLHDGDELDAAGLHFLVLHTPGHSPGGVSYVLKDERVVFCGDTLFYESAGRTDFPGCSQKELYHSIVDKLYKLDGDYAVYCGHEQATTLDHERACNPLTVYGGRFQW